MALIDFFSAAAAVCSAAKPRVAAKMTSGKIVLKTFMDRNYQVAGCCQSEIPASESLMPLLVPRQHHLAQKWRGGRSVAQQFIMEFLEEIGRALLPLPILPQL